MNMWRDFLDSLDTTGGHVFILLVLVSGLVVTAQFNPSDWVLRLLDMTAGAFFTALVGKVRNGKSGTP